MSPSCRPAGAASNCSARRRTRPSQIGAFTAARQSWLQWNPPEFATCGRDLFGMIESFPLQRAIPMIFKGAGDCSAVDWSFLGLTIANWSFVWFVIFMVTILVTLLKLPARRGGVMPA